MCFDDVPLGTRLRENPAIGTGFEDGTDADLDAHHTDHDERGPSKAVKCRTRVEKEGRRECCHSLGGRYLRS
jgi:hypothetical protein